MRVLEPEPLELTHRRLQASRGVSTPVTDVLNEAEAAATRGGSISKGFSWVAGVAEGVGGRDRLRLRRRWWARRVPCRKGWCRRW
jgi:hypothetical protein